MNYYRKFWNLLENGHRSDVVVHLSGKMNRFNKRYVKRWLIGGERSQEPQLISFYNKMELKQAMMLLERNSSASLNTAGRTTTTLQQSSRRTLNISKEREEEIRKILRANLQKTRQRLRSYSRHTLMLDPAEDDWSETHLRKQRVEIQRRMSLFLTVPAHRQDSPPIRRARFESDNQEHMTRPSILLNVPSVSSVLQDSVTIDNESEKRDESRRRRHGGDEKQEGERGIRGRKPSVTFALDLEEQKLSRCLRDLGPDQLNEDDEEPFLSQ